MNPQRQLRLTIAFTLGLLLALAPLAAFTQGQAVLRIVRSDSSEFPNMKVWVQANGTNNVPVPDLTAASFKLVESGSPVELVSVTPQSDADTQLSIGVALALDKSMSETVGGDTRLKMATRIVQKLIDQAASTDEIEIIGFSGDVKVGPDDVKERSFTSDKIALGAYLAGVANFNDSAVPTCAAVDKAVNTTANRTGQRAVLLIVAADDTTSTAGNLCTEVGGAASQRRIPVFVIGLNKALAAPELMKLTLDAERIRLVEKDDEWTPFLANLLTTLRRQYVIRYASKAPCDNGEYNLQVTFESKLGNASSFTAIKATPPETPAISLPLKQGQTVSRSLPITLTPQICAKNPVASTALMVDGNEVFRRDQAPFDLFVWDTTKYTGTHSLTARISDSTGKTGESKPVSVQVAGEPLSLALILFVIALVAMVLVFVFLMMRRRTFVPETVYDPGPIPASSGETSGRLVTPLVVPSTAPTPPADTRYTGGGSQAPSSPAKTVVLNRQEAPLAYLVVTKGSTSTQRFPLAAEATIGRDGQKNDVVLDDQSVSRDQAKVRLEGGQFYLYDLASTNPTVVNGRRVEGRHPLQNGDRITMGNVELVFKRV
ncbi:MAG: FHA domain-containing protein [Chloroflexi bacterium]|nr:FHA domain-containing protein [Chloroflexota bacterium]